MTESNATMGASVPMGGVINARDLGGYPTSDGKTVKNGMIVRSGKLKDATPEDVSLLTSMGIKLIIDLRTLIEISALPDPEISGIRSVHIGVIDESNPGSASMLAAQYANSTSIENLLKLYKSGIINYDIYADMLDSEYTMKEFRRFFDVILENGCPPFLFHCTGGKDRTGIASIILLSALGVDRKSCIENYLLSNESMRDTIEATVSMVRQFTDDEETLDAVRSIVGVKAAYAERLLDRAENIYGSVDGFLKNGFGLSDSDISALRNAYTE